MKESVFALIASTAVSPTAISLSSAYMANESRICITRFSSASTLRGVLNYQNLRR